MPLLSIVVPIYNKIKYLDACIFSILEQSFKDFELLLIDDGSTDGCKERCEFYASQDPRVKHISQENKGVSIARNIGLINSTGEYIGFVDADDVLELDMYEILIQNAIVDKSEISICDMWISEKEENNKTKSNIKKTVLSKVDTIKALFNGSINWSVNNKIFKAELAKKVYFEGAINEDLWYCFKVINLMMNNAVFTNQKKYNYIRRDNSASMSITNQLGSIIVSKNVLKEICLNHEEFINEAKSLDFLSNLSLLNLILLSPLKHCKEYQLVSQNLLEYNLFVKQTNLLNTKQKRAYEIFSFSPLIYKSFLKLYCLIFQSEAGRKLNI